MPETSRISGHTLQFEGAAHDDSGSRIPRIGNYGDGRGLCSCGELSPSFSSGNKRKAWYREHKLALAGESVGATIFEVHRRIADGELFDVLTEIPEPADPYFPVVLRNQADGRRHNIRVHGLVKKYERVTAEVTPKIKD